jgi:OOP family OmpA-OmpF porin
MQNKDLTFDGASGSNTERFWWNSFNGTFGITVYLGKNEKHADWVTLIDKDVLALTERVDNLETMLIDDQDGVADYLDLEKIQFLV